MNKNLIIGSCALFLAQAAIAGTHYDELKVEFDAANAPLTKQDLLGTYLGRCFTVESDVPVGMVLTTIENYTPATTTTVVVTPAVPAQPGEGPLFPEVPEVPAVTKTVVVTPAVDSWNMAMILYLDSKGDPLPADRNDSATPNSVNSFWAHPQTADHFGNPMDLTVSELVLSGGMASSTMTSYIGNIDIDEVKKGQDGYFYGKARQAEDSSGVAIEYCYFWKKLF